MGSPAGAARRVLTGDHPRAGVSRHRSLRAYPDRCEPSGYVATTAGGLCAPNPASRVHVRSPCCEQAWRMKGATKKPKSRTWRASLICKRTEFLGHGAGPRGGRGRGGRAVQAHGGAAEAARAAGATVGLMANVSGRQLAIRYPAFFFTPSTLSPLFKRCRFTLKISQCARYFL